jgi:hypothetical protein
MKLITTEITINEDYNGNVMGTFPIIQNCLGIVNNEVRVWKDENSYRSYPCSLKDGVVKIRDIKYNKVKDSKVTACVLIGVDNSHRFGYDIYELEKAVIKIEDKMSKIQEKSRTMNVTLLLFGAGLFFGVLSLLVR